MYVYLVECKFIYKLFRRIRCKLQFFHCWVPNECCVYSHSCVGFNICYTTFWVCIVHVSVRIYSVWVLISLTCWQKYDSDGFMLTSMGNREEINHISMTCLPVYVLHSQLIFWFWYIEDECIRLNTDLCACVTYMYMWLWFWYIACQVLHECIKVKHRCSTSIRHLEYEINNFQTWFNRIVMEVLKYCLM